VQSFESCMNRSQANQEQLLTSLCAKDTLIVLTMIIAFLSVLATLIAFSSNAATAFSVRPLTSSRLSPSFRPLNAAKYRELEDLQFEEDDGEVIRVKVKDIERDWTYDGYKAEGDMSVDLFLPGSSKIKGCVFFMHGFSQYPVAYRKTLKKVSDEADVAIIAVETGVTTKVSRDKDKQYGLQRAVSQDTAQCIRMVKEGDECFAKHGIPKNVPLGICGHSMVSKRVSEICVSLFTFKH